MTSRLACFRAPCHGIGQQFPQHHRTWSIILIGGCNCLRPTCYSSRGTTTTSSSNPKTHCYSDVQPSISAYITLIFSECSLRSVVLNTNLCRPAHWRRRLLVSSLPSWLSVCCGALVIRFITALLLIRQWRLFI